MYFLEQGNVDDDATFITIFLVSFNLQSCCLMQSAVCSLQMSYTDLKVPIISLRKADFKFCFFCSIRLLNRGLYFPVIINWKTLRMLCCRLYLEVKLGQGKEM